MPVPITALYASLLGLLLLFLSYRVVRCRQASKVGLGDGGDTALAHAMRVQANLTEYAPLALILLMLLELNGAPRWLLHATGGSFALARLMHAWGFARHSGVSFGRFWGTALTWAALLVLALLDLAYFIKWV